MKIATILGILTAVAVLSCDSKSQDEPPNPYEMACSRVVPNTITGLNSIWRCENAEAVCYGTYNTGLSCVGKKP